MKTIYNELARLYSEPIIRIIVIFTFFTNLLVGIYYFKDEKAGTVKYSQKDYKAIMSVIEEEGINEYKAIIDITKEYCFENDGSQDEIEKLKLRNLYTDIATLAYSCDKYSEIYEGIKKEIDKRELVGLNRYYTDYDRKLEMKYLNDYERIKDISPRFGSSKGIDLLLEYNITDFLLTVLGIFSIVFLFVKEREAKHLSLIKSTYNGRYIYIISQISAVFINGVILFIIYHFTNVILAYKMYGFGDLSRSVQSISSMRLCPFNITIIEFLFIYYGIKFVIAILALVVIYMLAVHSHSIQSFYIKLFLLVVLLLAFNNIRDKSLVEFLKVISLDWIFSMSRAFTNDVLVNCFGTPVNILYVSMLVYIGIIVIAMTYNIISYSQSYENETRARNGLNLGLVHRSTNIWWNEIYKFLWHEKNILFIAGVIVVAFVMYEPADRKFFINEDPYYIFYVEELKGPVTEEKIEYLDKEKVRFDQIKLNLDLSNPSSEEYRYLSEMYAPYKSFEKIYYETTPYLLSKGGEYVYDTGYRILTGDFVAGKADVINAVLLVAFALFPIISLFGIDYKYGIFVIQRISYCGYKKINFIKYIIAIVYSTLIYLVVYGPFLYSVLSVYGVEGIEYSACSMIHLSNIPECISIQNYIWGVMFIRYIGLQLMVVCVYAIVNRVKNVVSSFVISVSLFMIPLILVIYDVPFSKWILINPLLLGNVVI